MRRPTAIGDHAATCATSASSRSSTAYSSRLAVAADRRRRPRGRTRRRTPSSRLEQRRVRRRRAGRRTSRPRARSVWWRSSRRRRPPVSSRNRSSSRSRELGRAHRRSIRAAASSIASGMPSSRRQISPTASASSARRARSRGTAARARSTNSATASPLRPSRIAERRHRPEPLAVEPQALAARRQHLHARARAQRSPRRARRAGVEEVLAVVEHQQQLPAAQALDDALVHVDCPALRRTAQRGGDRIGHRVRVADRRELARTTRRRGYSADHLGRRPAARGGSCRRRPTPVSVTSRASASASAIAASSSSRPTNACAAAAGSPGSASSDRSGGNSRSQVRVRAPGRPAPARPRSRRRCSPRSTQLDAVGSSSRTSSLGRLRHHDLAAVRDRHQPRRTVHRRAVVVAVAQLRLAGVQAHPHPQRRRSAPTLRRAARAARRPRRRPRRDARRERGVDAVAGRLDDVAAVRARSPSRRIASWRASAAAHRVGVLLPQARRALEVGEQERHRPRRQLRHLGSPRSAARSIPGIDPAWVGHLRSTPPPVTIRTA